MSKKMKFGDTVYVISGIVRAVEYRGEYTCDWTGKTFAKIWMTILPTGQSFFKIHDFSRESVYTTKKEANKALFMRVLKGED